MRDPLDDALGLPPVPREERDVVIPDSVSQDGDYEFARRNIYRLIAKGEDVLDELSDIARVSEHPRAYEVYANMYRSLVETNKDLMGLKKTHQDLQPREGPTSVHNTLVMTSEEVLRMMKEKK